MKSKKLFRNASIGVLLICFMAFAAVPAAFAAEAPAAKAAAPAAAAPAAKAETPAAAPVAKAMAKAVPSDEVKALQEALVKAGAKVKADGLMGKQTKTALKTFQKKNGLKISGKADDKTLAKLGLK